MLTSQPPESKLPKSATQPQESNTPEGERQIQESNTLRQEGLGYVETEVTYVGVCRCRE